ncbi:hypothetical protein ACQPZF_28060 [Actinosynnema sp. CS-041913]|uniref:hypothetical protein n=1 Tax=Actinosynnema sp. CS-041913 TaxID=3239917 RepID=UPI003D90C1F5
MTGGGAEDESGATRNVHHGPVDRVVQARDIHGDVHLTGPKLRAWLLPTAVLGVAVVVAALVVSWPSGPTAANPDAPPDLRVTADMTHNDQGPWGYVSESAEFPGPELLARLAQPMSAVDRTLIKDVRTQPNAVSLQQHTVRLHLEGSRDRPVRVTDIRPAVRRSTAPLSGSLVQVYPQGGEESSNVHLYLDDAFPSLMATTPVPSPPPGQSGKREPTGPFFPSSTINLAPGETHEVALTTFARLRAYEYELVVVHQEGDRLRETVVNDGGRPFRVSGLACSGPQEVSYRSAYLLATGFSVGPVPYPRRFGVSYRDCT